MKNEFIYSVSEIFDSVLDIAGLKQYYIGPYQRGYKWSSENIYDEVPQLLIDVYEAFKNGTEEYYLQYITVLRNAALDSYEVIDGQQRLTTLAIIFDRFSAKTNNAVRSIAFNRIEYSRDISIADDDHEHQADVVPVTLFDKIKGTDAEGNALEDTQDLFYIQSATRCIDLFLERLEEFGELYEYAEFLLNNVKIILNRESDFVSAEEVFANLNGNRVELTNSYLIKGLLLTKGIHSTDRNGLRVPYNNIIEQRRVNGRLWDEIQNWIEQFNICYFFFGEKVAENGKGMEQLLELLLRYGLGQSGYPEKSTTKQLIDCFRRDLSNDNESLDYFVGFRLFNQYNELIINEEDGFECMLRLIHVYKKLRTMYETAQIYNMLGYILFSQKTKASENLLTIIDLGYNKLRKFLVEKILEIMPDLSKGDLRYKDSRLTPLLLSFSVFPEKYSEDYRFDFVSFDRNNWTLEHISPQNPKTEGIVIPQYCKEQIIQLYKRQKESDTLDRIKQATKENEADFDKNNILEILQSDEQDRKMVLSECEGEKWIIDDVENYPFLYSDIGDEHLHSMGNMALLSNPVNSSLSNNPFIIKRGEIFNKAEKGVFIPVHTMSAFSKSLNTTKNDTATQFSSDNLIWDSVDIEAHAEWMRVRNADIIKFINEFLPKQ